MRRYPPLWRMVALIVIAAFIDAAFSIAHVHFSAAVFGLLVLLGAMVVRGRVDAGLERAGRGLLRWLPLFFVPATVGVMEYGATLRHSWIGVLVALGGSTLLGGVVAAVVGSAIVARKMEKT